MNNSRDKQPENHRPSKIIKHKIFDLQGLFLVLIIFFAVFMMMKSMKTEDISPQLMNESEMKMKKMGQDAGY